jgi:glycosyltransferase involved in cell wall biosynthesis
MSLPLVHVLLASYNGAAHLREQLESLARQTGVELRLYVSDDDSSDNSMALLREFNHCPTEFFPSHRRLGATANYFHLLRGVLPHVKDGEWVAFCDQDDIWHDDKLARAIAALKQVAPGQPAAYGSRTLVVDVHNQPLGLSALHPRPTGFANAVVQCMAGANTLVFNAQTLRLMLRPEQLDLPSHDWWCYQVVTGCGGVFVYDPKPSLRYRQHDSNEVGFNQGLRARLERLGSLLAGDYREWNSSNLQTMGQLEPYLTAEARAICESFQRARSAPWFWQRLAALRRSGVYRQSQIQSLALGVACLLNRL